MTIDSTLHTSVLSSNVTASTRQNPSRGANIKTVLYDCHVMLKHVR